MKWNVGAIFMIVRQWESNRGRIYPYRAQARFATTDLRVHFHRRVSQRHDSGDQDRSVEHHAQAMQAVELGLLSVLFRSWLQGFQNGLRRVGLRKDHQTGVKGAAEHKENHEDSNPRKGLFQQAAKS